MRSPLTWRFSTRKVRVSNGRKVSTRKHPMATAATTDENESLLTWGICGSNVECALTADSSICLVVLIGMSVL